MQLTGSSYIDIPLFLALAAGVDVLDYLSGNTVLAAPASPGATLLTVSNNANFATSQPVYILDGPNSEIVFADPTNPTNSGTTNQLKTSATTLAHSLGASVSSGGAQGTLAQMLMSASSWAENFCFQGNYSDRSLFRQARSDNYELGTTHAYLDANYTLVVRPNFFPVISVSALSIEQAPAFAITLDTTALEFDSRQRLIMSPVLQRVGVITGDPWLFNGAFLTREDQGWVRLTYTAGLDPANLPDDFQQAVCWIAQEFIGYSQNPTGAAQFRHGDTWITQRLRGRDVDSTADGVFIMQARNVLNRYRNEFI